jgi:uncharacterized low-complexity protein
MRIFANLLVVAVLALGLTAFTNAAMDGSHQTQVTEKTMGDKCTKGKCDKDKKKTECDKSKCDKANCDKSKCNKPKEDSKEKSS